MLSHRFRGVTSLSPSPNENGEVLPWEDVEISSSLARTRVCVCGGGWGSERFDLDKTVTLTLVR